MRANINFCLLTRTGGFNGDGGGLASRSFLQFGDKAHVGFFVTHCRFDFPVFKKSPLNGAQKKQILSELKGEVASIGDQVGRHLCRALGFTCAMSTALSFWPTLKSRFTVSGADGS